jgi:hypothetical protein
MRQPLKRHPDSLGVAASHIEVEVARPRADRLVLSYVVTGKISGIRMPVVVAAARGEELWQHTCFEAFVRASSGDGYYEFNFSPSTQWAAYRFGGYRSGMSVPAEVRPFAIDVQSTPDRYTLQTSLELDRLPGLPHADVWRLGLSAVIEEMGGQKSYWALAHPPGRPDFHHMDCFTHEFSLAVQP